MATSSDLLDATHSETLKPSSTQGVKGVDEDGLAVVTEEKLVLGEPISRPGGMKEGAISEVKPSVERKSKGKKNLKKRSTCSAQPLPRKVERQSYTVKMDEVEYKSLEVFKSHACKPECGSGYFVCKHRAHAVELHFKKFMESIFGRESAKMVSGLRIEYIYFTCYLTDEEAKILEGKQGVVCVEPLKDLGGRYC